MNKDKNIYIDSGMKLTIPSTTKVTCNNKMIMFFPSGVEEELNVKIEADFKDLNPKHHEIFLNSFSSRYNHDVQIFNTHTNYDGSKVPKVVGKVTERKSLWKQVKKLFNLKKYE
jgi:hypothetical protein